MRFGLALFGMSLAAPVTVGGTQYLVGLVKNNDGEFPFATFKSASEVSVMTVKSEMETFGIVVVEGSAEAAKALEQLSYVKYVEEDGVVEALDGGDMGMGMGLQSMDPMEEEDMGMLEGEDSGM